MNPVPVFLLIAFALGVQAHNLSPRTFALFPSGLASQQSHHIAHTHQHGSHATQAEGHHNHAPSVHQSTSHATQAEGHHNHVPSVHQPHVGHAHQVPVNVHTGHAVPEHHGGHGHVHNHQQSSMSPATSAGVPSNVSSVPVLVCRVVHVPVTPAPPAPSSSPAGSVIPPAVFGNITTRLDTVIGRVVDPVVALLHNASVWLNRTAHRHNVHGGHVHQHHQHSSVSAVDAVHQKVLALKMHKNPKHPGAGQIPVTHDTPAATTPARSLTSTADAATETSSPVRTTTNAVAATTKARVPAQVLTSTVGAPAPRLLTELSPTEDPVSPFSEITDGSTSTGAAASATPPVSEAISVKSGHIFTTQTPTTVTSGQSSTEPAVVFDPTPRSPGAPSSRDTCSPLTLRCQPQVRKNICRKYEKCLLGDSLRSGCMAVLVYEVFIDERCTPA